MWSGVAVVWLICGLAVAWATGSTPRWSGLAVVLVLLVALAIFAAVRIADQRLRDRASLQAKHTKADRTAALNRIVEAIFEHATVQRLEWLRGQDFAAPWRDSEFAPFRELVQFREMLDPRFDSDVSDAVLDLIESTEAFFDFYSENTFPDRLVLDGDWRDIGPSTLDAETDEATDMALLERHRLGLCEAGQAIVQAYDVLVYAYRLQPR
jgi:hypothetical protein